MSSCDSTRRRVRGWRSTAAMTTTLLVACGLAGCGKKEEAEGPKVSPAAQQEADQIFASRCATCHGTDGSGNGPASAGLSPKPRNFHDPAWQSSVTDEHIEKIIQYGGAAVGKSAAMPSNPDLASKPEVVTALRMHVRSLK